MWPAGGLVVADEAGEDRQPGGVGGCPGVRPQRGRAEVPAGAGVSIPMRSATVLGEGPVELVERAAVAVDDEHVAVAVAAGAALDRGTGRNRERAAVALVAVGGVVDRQVALVGADHRVGEAIGARGSEVGVEHGRRRGRRCRRSSPPSSGATGAFEMSWFQAASFGSDGARAERDGGRVGEDRAATEVGVGADGGARPGSGGGKPDGRRDDPSGTSLKPAAVPRGSEAGRRRAPRPRACRSSPPYREATDGEPADREAADRGGADGEGADRRRAARLGAGRRRGSGLGPEDRDSSHGRTVAPTLGRAT